MTKEENIARLEMLVEQARRNLKQAESSNDYKKIDQYTRELKMYSAQLDVVRNQG